MAVRQSRKRSNITAAIENAIVQELMHTEKSMKEIAVSYGVSATAVTEINKRFNSDGTPIHATETETDTDKESETAQGLSSP